MEDKIFDQCMARITAGDRQALKEIYEAYDGYIYTIIYNLVDNREDAEELTVDCFVRIWDKASSYKEGTSHHAWMATIARNIALDHLRKRKREVLSEELPERSDQIQEPSPEQQVVSGMNFRDLLRSLSLDERQIVTMKILGELTFKEIASMMDMSIGTVSWKYNESLRKLRRAEA